MTGPTDKKMFERFFENAVKRVPWFKYAWIIPLTLALVIITDRFRKDFRTIIIWSIVVLMLCVIGFIIQKSFQKDQNFLKYLGRVILIACVLSFVAALYLIVFSFSKTEDMLTTLVVSIYDSAKGKQDLILRNQGSVVVEFGGEKRLEQISEKGQAHFRNIPIGTKALINIDFSEPYRSIWPDSLFTIHKNGNIYLPVKLYGVERIYGVVTSDKEPLGGVRVSVGPSVSYSDSLGNYSLSITDSLQQKFYNVFFNKQGYVPVEEIATPQIGKSLDITMQKSTFQ